MPEEFERVFVYGTLLSGESNHYLLEGSELMGKTVANGFDLKDLGPFPACVENPLSTTSVEGEVWMVTKEVLARLDRLEGYPTFYNRKKIWTFFDDCWIYFCNAEKDNPTILSGSWKQHLGRE